MRIKSNNKGFSLVELAIAMLMLGLLLSTTIATYNLYKARHTLSLTEGRATPVRVALQRFYALNGRFPCPADPALNETHGMAGVEFCLSAVVAPGSCSGGLCRANGARGDVNLDGLADTILTGGIPYTTLGIVPKETYDGWNNKLGYAVSELLTASATYADNLGVIEVLNPVGASADSSVPAQQYKFVVWSFGSSKRGAYTPQGVLAADCTGQGLDLENCDNDSSFLTATSPGAGGATVSIRSGVTGPDFYDSYILLYKMYLNTDFWSPSPAVTNTMTNAFNGKVGIGVNNPQAALDIDGSVTVNAPEGVRSTQYCNETGAACFEPKIIGGNDSTGGMTCHGESMIGIKDGDAKCDSSTVTITPGSLPYQTCPTGQYVVGINAGTGAFICQPN